MYEYYVCMCLIKYVCINCTGFSVEEQVVQSMDEVVELPENFKVCGDKEIPWVTDSLKTENSSVSTVDEDTQQLNSIGKQEKTVHGLDPGPMTCAVASSSDPGQVKQQVVAFAVNHGMKEPVIWDKQEVAKAADTRQDLRQVVDVMHEEDLFAVSRQQLNDDTCTNVNAEQPVLGGQSNGEHEIPTSQPTSDGNEPSDAVSQHCSEGNPVNAAGTRQHRTTDVSLMRFESGLLPPPHVTPTEILDNTNVSNLQYIAGSYSYDHHSPIVSGCQTSQMGIDDCSPSTTFVTVGTIYYNRNYTPVDQHLSGSRGLPGTDSSPREHSMSPRDDEYSTDDELASDVDSGPQALACTKESSKGPPCLDAEEDVHSASRFEKLVYVDNYSRQTCISGMKHLTSAVLHVSS